MRLVVLMVALLLLLYCIPSSSEPLSKGDVRTAAECAVLFEIRESGATDQKFKDDQEFRKKFMMALVIKSGLPIDRFTDIGNAYKKDFDAKASKGDQGARDYVLGQIQRCMLFSKQQAVRITKQYNEGKT